MLKDKAVLHEKAVKYSSVFLMIIFFIQLAVIIWMNLTQLPYHGGFDATKEYIATIHMVKTHRLFMDDWGPTTGYPFFTVTSLSALFYLITDNLFLSYGIVMSLMTALEVFMLYKVIRTMGYDGAPLWLALNFFVTTYIDKGYTNENDLGWASSTLTSASYYSPAIILALATVLYLISEKGKVAKVFGGAVIILASAAFTVSRGLSLWMLALIPLFGYFVLKVIVKNDIKEILCCEFSFLMTDLVFCFLAKMIAGMFPYFQNPEGDFYLRMSQGLPNAFGNILIGLFNLINALPQFEVSVMSLDVVPYLFKVFLVLSAITAFVVYSIEWIRKGKTEERSIHIAAILIAVNILFFMLVPLNYSIDTFEARYWCVGFPFFLILLCAMISEKLNGYLKSSVILVLLLATVVLHITGDKNYITCKNEYDEYQKAIALMEGYDAPVVYGYGDVIGIDMIRIMDPDRHYNVIDEEFNLPNWGEVIAFREAGEYQGPTLILCTKEVYPQIPAHILNYYYPIGETEKYMALYSSYNVIDYSSEMKYQRSIDYPYSPGYAAQNGALDNSGAWITDGTEGYALYGPNVATYSGIYDYTFYYECSDDNTSDSYFEITLDGGTTVIAKAPLDPKEKYVTVSGIQIEAGHTLEQRFYNAEGEKVKICSICRERVEE